jgi:hypothetical protein
VKFKRALYLTHRWFGILMCLVFFLWFASGIVMMYVEYPMLTEQERIRSLSPLEIDAIEIEVSALEKRIKPEQRVIGFSITSHLDRPVFHAQFGDGTTLVMFADTGETLGPTTESSAVEAARIFARNSALGAAARYLEALEMDQWTVYGGFSSHRPLHKVALDNPNGTIVYVSTSTGQVVRDTHTWERGWNWVGSTIHWIYPMQLRRFPDTWVNVVIVVSTLGIIAVTTGTVVGFLRLRTKRRYKGGAVTPYQGMQKWHHLLGLAFALFVTTFLVSGLFSMNPFGIFDDSSSPQPQISRYEGGTLQLSGLQDALAPLRFLVGDMPGVKELTWHQINGSGVLVAHSIDGRSVINMTPAELLARVTQSVPLLLPQESLVQMERLEQFDNYYYSTHNRYRPLPAFRVRFDDEEKTWYYIDAVTGELLFRSTATKRVERWLYNGLHSLDFQVLLANRPLWDIVVIILSLAGVVLSYTSVAIAWRRLRRTRFSGVGVRKTLRASRNQV